MKFLLADNDECFLSEIKEILHDPNINIYTTSDGQEALDYYSNGKGILLVILGANLSSISGFEVCRQIRAMAEVPIIITSDSQDKEQELRAFSARASEYIKKPCDRDIFLARVHNLLRREFANRIKIRDLEIKQRSRKVYLNDVEIVLTSKEYELLIYLFRNCNRVLKRDIILNKVWGMDYFGEDRTVDTHVKNLRHKLKYEKDLIKTIRNEGYVFEIEEYNIIPNLFSYPK